MPPKSDTFYFLHQIKLQTLPYVEKQITQFIQHFTNHLHLQHQLNNQQQKNLWQQKVNIYYAIMEKKIKQIQNFHYHNWMDYRANLVLRSKKILIQFFQTNKHLLSTLNPSSLNHQFNSLNVDINIAQNQYSDEEVFLQYQNSLQKDAQKSQQIKESVKKIKTQMVQKPSKLNLTIKNVKKVQTKQTKKSKNPTVKISKHEINKQISKIIDKSNNQKPKNNLVFASRRTNELKGDNPKKQISSNQQKINNQMSNKNLSRNKKNNMISRQRQRIQQVLQGSIQKQINQSVEKASYSINKSKQKSTNKYAITKKTQTNVGKKPIKENDNKKKPKIATKNMTKEQYIQYLIDKNRLNISTSNF